MNAGIDTMIEKAYFISPIVDMERLISDMMLWSNVTEDELKNKGVIPTSFGEDLSWDYLCYVRERPIKWTVPTAILYGSKDNLTSLDTITTFAKDHNAKLTVMENGDHWLCTKEQMLLFAYDRLFEDKSEIPLISFPEPVCNEAVRRKYKKVGLLGTVFTMEKEYMKKDLNEGK